jgi:SAM-dependent methyltransferase
LSDRRFHIRSDCRACGSHGLDLVVSLNPLPLVSPNVGVEPDEAASAARVCVPLDLHLCADCGLLQLNAVIDPAFQYNKFKYVTAISVGLPEHFRKSAGEILRRAGLAEIGRVVEIGSNDGTLLRAFGERGWQILGIDPAEKAAAVARAHGVPTITGFFNAASAHDLRRRIGDADLVIANNTLANIDDLNEVAIGLDAVLAADGVFVFETSYGASVVSKTLLDTIYHEHLSYFTVKPLQAYFTRHGFELFHVDEIATKGGSIRGFVQHAGGARPVSASVSELIATEYALGLYCGAAYRRMSAAIDETRRNLAEAVARFGDSNRAVAGYGASVGCVSLVNQLNLTTELACLFDDRPLLDVILGPDYAIPVVASQEIYRRRPELIVILAWRYANLIMNRHRTFMATGGRFVLPLPEVAVQ